MKKSVIKSAKTVEEAVRIALAELGTTKENVDIDVIEEPSSGFLGLLGVKPAIVKIVEKEGQQRRSWDIGEIEKEPKEEPKEKQIEKVKRYEKKDPDKEIKPQDIEKKEAKLQKEEFDVVEFLQQICDYIMPGCEVTKASENKEAINLEIEGDNLGLIVGKHGETLNAIQYITAMVFNNNFKDYKRVNVDAGGYRKRREENSIEFSMKMANKVKRTGRRISLEPMNSYERRIVHMALQKVDGINTYSEGREPYRKIVITSTDRISNTKRKTSAPEKVEKKVDQKEQIREQRAKEEQRYKALEKQHDQLNSENEATYEDDDLEDNPYEHYYSKYDNRIKK